MCLTNAYKNIIFVSSLTNNGYEFQLMDDVCNIYFGNDIVGMSYLNNGLYYIDNNSKKNSKKAKWD